MKTEKTIWTIENLTKEISERDEKYDHLYLFPKRFLIKKLNELKNKHD